MENQELKIEKLEATVQALETRLTELEDDTSCLRCFLEDIGIIDGQRLPWER